MSLLHNVRELHGALVPITRRIGHFDLSVGSREVYEMTVVPGIRFDCVRPLQHDLDGHSVTKIKTLLEGMTAYFATTFMTTDMEASTSCGKSSGRMNVTLLERLTKLAQGAMQSLPVVLPHGDLLPTNIFVDQGAWALTGLVDWAEAENLPFGIGLYGIDHLLGYMDDARQWVWYDKPETLRKHFWSCLQERLPAWVPKESTPTNAVRLARVHTRSPAKARLTKAAPVQAHGRQPSLPYLEPLEQAQPILSQPTLQDLKREHALRDQFGMPSPPLPAPPAFAPSHSRPSSRDRSRPGTPSPLAGSATGTGSGGSRPATPTIQINGQHSMTPTTPSKSAEKEKKNGWFRKGSTGEVKPMGPTAWIAGAPQKITYDAEILLQAQPVAELWNEMDGNCFVYLFPRESGRGPSFKVDSAIFASSPVLSKMAFGDSPSRSTQGWPLDAKMQGLSVNDQMGTMSSASSQNSRGRYSTFSTSSADPVHLFMPLKLGASPLDDLQTLIDFRNFFAFLCGQSIVATEKRHTFFQIFMTLASILKGHDFGNFDGSTYGEVANGSFDAYVQELGLADVRASRERTIEGIVLGERMKNVLLYNEAFTHAVGKLEDLTGSKNAKSALISTISQQRLGRAAMDLEKRTASIRLILNDFEFPAIFSGIMISKVAEERKEGVRFDAWKDGFFGMRKWYLATLKQRYGDWPPKAKSKKNDLETSGLQRIVLQDLYRDLSEIYDLLVDRRHLTTRSVDGVDHEGTREEPTIRALRAVLSEYDRSSPPVKPPMPFDLPMLPTLRSTHPDFGTGDKKKDLKAISKKLKDDEIAAITRACLNPDTPLSTFVSGFRDMEKRAMHGCNIAELVDLRVGQWIFLYAVLQALPMLACDAPGLRYTQGVEYFLCEPPRSGVPWADPERAATAGGKRAWYAVGEAGDVVSLPSDVVEHGVEGIYRRSHCWVMAKRWTARDASMSTKLHQQEATNAHDLSIGQRGRGLGDVPPVPPVHGMLQTNSGREVSSSRAHHRNSSLMMGLEPLPLPPSFAPENGHEARSSSVERPRSSHNVDANKTFDAILGEVNGKGKKGTKK
ncbi:hypothetical protein B0A48_09971 [Cryoendolithus antarcticus]|uniref:DUF8004 domain-containing protein n=1 Tax=Cryoendolithus antarcticus TaxID=1507870 RepID=A0A1V8T387_9PEZI|nr:hypothetical protein B0A48_09971 [Cryoendolithus antarcticus]